MAINLSDLQNVDLADLSTWPQWFKGFLVLLVLGGVLYGGYHFIISHQLKDLERLEKEESQLKDTFLDRKSKAINLPVYREQMTEMENTFQVMLGQLPDRNEVPQLLIDISQAGISRGLDFNRFTPAGERQGGFYATLPINLSVSGSYHQFGQFVSDLAALPRIVTVGNINLDRRDDEELSVTAVVQTFRYLGGSEEYTGDDKSKARAVRK